MDDSDKPSLSRDEEPAKFVSPQTSRIEPYFAYERPAEPKKANPSLVPALILLAASGLIAHKLWSSHLANEIATAPESAPIAAESQALPPVEAKLEPISEPGVLVPGKIIYPDAEAPSRQALTPQKKRKYPYSEYQMMLREDFARFLEYTEQPRYGPLSKVDQVLTAPLLTAAQDKNLQYYEEMMSKNARHVAEDKPGFVGVVARCHLEGHGYHYVTADGLRSDLDAIVNPDPMLVLASKTLALPGMADRYIFVFRDHVEIESRDGDIKTEIENSN